jgi:phage FluMu gp28-like protein
MSFCQAGESVAKAHLNDGYIGHFVSYNRLDAQEKIAYAREFYESLPLEFQKKLTRESRTELEFEGSDGSKKSRARIISHPCKAPRGRHGDVYLDEFAHYPEDMKVYMGSTALIARVPEAQLTACTTPLGTRGLFWEIDSQAHRRYKRHTRQYIPWWLCKAYCRDIAEAAKLAPYMSAADAVELFGTEVLKEQFDAMPEEEFEQEFGGKYTDERGRYFPYSLLLSCTSSEMNPTDDISRLHFDGNRLVAGYDVGRDHDTSDLAIFEEIGDVYHCRLLRTFTNTPFAEQESYLRQVLDTLPIARFSIDNTGMGKNMAENLSTDYPNVEECTFTNASKERWVISMKLLMQRRRIRLPASRDIEYQFGYIKRTVLPSGKVRYDGRTPEGHADMFWAIALAAKQEESVIVHKPRGVEVLVFGAG